MRSRVVVKVSERTVAESKNIKYFHKWAIVRNNNPFISFPFQILSTAQSKYSLSYSFIKLFLCITVCSYSIEKHVSFYYIVYYKQNNKMEIETTQVQGEENIKFDRFSIFLIAKNSQNAFGVKVGDYMRYRRYCTRKVEKMRKTMEYKYGNRTKFIKKDVTEDKCNDRRVLQVALFTCERYWASANECKFNGSLKQSNKLRAKFMAIKKFKRAHLWSTKLLKVCQSKTDPITISEAEAYSYYMEGLFYLEKQDWKIAQAKLIACREIISDLLGNIDTMNAKVYREKIDQIDQTIKFCNFKISKGQELSIEEIIEMRKNGEESLSTLIGTFAQKRLKELSLDSGNQIHFGNERYPIKDEKIIQQKSKIDLQLSNLEIIKKKSLTESGDEQLFEQLLNFFSSIIILIDETVKMVDVHKENVRQYTQGEIAVYKKVSLLFEQIKLNVMIDRNNMIFKHSLSITDKESKKNAPQTLAKLLSNSIAIYSQYVELQKLKNQGSDGVDPQKIRAIDSKIFYYRTLRLFFVGQVYFNNDKIKQSYSLWQQCERCLQSVKNSQQQQTVQQLNLISLDFVTSQLRSNKVKCVIRNYKANQGAKETLNTQMQKLDVKQKKSDFTLYELMTGKAGNQGQLTLAEYSELDPIQLPGKLQLIPTRPIFFDLFESQIHYPTLETKSQGGWFGKLFKKGN